MLSSIVSILRIRLEGNFSGTKSATKTFSKGRDEPQETRYAPLDVETENLDSVVVLPLHSLLPSIELLALVDVFPVGVTTPA